MPSPHHHDDVAGRAALAHETPLVLRQQSGVELIDAERAGDGAGRALVVAGEHDGGDTAGLELRDRLARRRLELVALSDDGARRAVHDQVADGEPARRKAGESIAVVGDALVVKAPRARDESMRAIVEHALHADARKRPHVEHAI